jgi:hypothetical protein
VFLLSRPPARKRPVSVPLIGMLLPPPVSVKSAVNDWPAASIATGADPVVEITARSRRHLICSGTGTSMSATSPPPADTVKLIGASADPSASPVYVSPASGLVGEAPCARASHTNEASAAITPPRIPRVNHRRHHPTRLNIPLRGGGIHSTVGPPGTVR